MKKLKTFQPMTRVKKRVSQSRRKNNRHYTKIYVLFVHIFLLQFRDFSWFCKFPFFIFHKLDFTSLKLLTCQKQYAFNQLKEIFE